MVRRNIVNIGSSNVILQGVCVYWMDYKRDRDQWSLVPSSLRYVNGITSITDWSTRHRSTLTHTRWNASVKIQSHAQGPTVYRARR